MPESPSKRTRWLSLLGLTGVLVAGGASADGMASAAAGVPMPEGSAHLTALVGSAQLGDEPLQPRSKLGDGTDIATGEDGNASMLVDEDNLVELCASTKMKLKRNDETGGRVIEVGAGTTRIIVDPMSGNEPLQISTPAAIATIMGTVVYVTVDAVTGETTIASEDHRVKIESNDPNVKQTTTIDGMESITLLPGQAPGAPKKMAKSVLENISGCLMDVHGVALAYDRALAADDAQDRMARSDGDVAELPVVGLGAPIVTEIETPSEEGLEDPADIISPVDVVDPPQMTDDIDFPNPCGGIPGDGCFPFPSGGGGQDGPS